MTKYLLIRTQSYRENTAEYGFGDHPDQIDYIGAVVEADTFRKAQNACKKIDPNIRFGGINSPMLVEAFGMMGRPYLKAADSRLSREAVHTHRASLEDLGLPPYGSEAIEAALKTWKA